MHKTICNSKYIIYISFRGVCRIQKNLAVKILLTVLCITMSLLSLLRKTKIYYY